MEETLSSVRATAGVLCYLAVAYAIPWWLIQKGLKKHYREWVHSNAYWHRRSGKWIIGSKIFYTDEFWMDVVVSIVSGAIAGHVANAALERVGDVVVPRFFLVGTVVASALLLFVATQFERFSLIDSELAVKRMTDPGFDNEAEIQKVLNDKHSLVKRVIRRPKVES